MDIRRGVRRSPKYCPISEAIKHHIPDAEVFSNQYDINVKPSYHHSTRYTNSLDLHLWILGFDNGLKREPITIALNKEQKTASIVEVQIE